MRKNVNMDGKWTHVAPNFVQKVIWIFQSRAWTPDQTNNINSHVFSPLKTIAKAKASLEVLKPLKLKCNEEFKSSYPN